MRPLTLSWRGPLDACTYACGYCPFAKRAPRRRVLDADRAALLRFVGWVEAATTWSLAVQFTPWGEGLVWPWYRDALVRISHLSHVRRVAIQTHGAAPMDFVARADRERLALWISWHPTQVSRERFLSRIAALRDAGVRLSVGAVAVPEHLAEIEALRADLPREVPLWINAQKPGPRYDADAIARWTALDPDFALDARPHRTRGRACLAGEEALHVDGDGALHRCHFVPERLGNLYTDDLAALLAPRPCPRAKCDCYIGYAWIPDLGLHARFGDDLVARIRP